jgi:2-keto-4-pentenoate hydratase/2-oxohepta-3-ene-1,7-dioic acid hydratase in catechol pathway
MVTRLVRVEPPGGGAPVFGRLEGGVIFALEGSQEGLLGALAAGQPLRDAGPSWLASECRVLAPVSPSKCVGLNYRHHALEMGKPLPAEPLIFLKPSTSVLGPGGVIVLPAQSSLVHHEGEMALVIGRRASGVSQAEALGYVAGVTCLNDVTARDIQRRENNYTRAKGFDTFAPLGPCVVGGLDPDALRVQARVNGEVRQDSTTADMIFSSAALVAFVSEIMTLEPGDLISTGTPSGVGPLVDGDEVEVEVEGVGVLSNRAARRA